jgi:hypothetical protein
MNDKKYEYRTIVGNVHMRERREGESSEAYHSSLVADLMIVDPPKPPNSDGWEFVATVFAAGNIFPNFVAREWRRETKEPAPANRLEMPTKELVRDWMRIAHNRVEEQARAKQKGIWQSALDDVAAEYIAEQLAELLKDATDENEDEPSEVFQAEVRAEIDEAR